MTAESLIKEVRYQLNDRYKTEFSDDELLSYLNQALRYINNVGVNLNSKLFLKRVELSLNNGVALLPSDFVKEKRVKSGGLTLRSDTDYAIIGDKIRSRYSPLLLEYYHQIGQLNSLSDTIPVKDIFINPIKQIVIYLALNRTNVNARLELELGELYRRELHKIFKLYGNTKVKKDVPFRL